MYIYIYMFIHHNICHDILCKHWPRTGFHNWKFPAMTAVMAWPVFKGDPWPTPLKNDGELVSWDDDIPNWMENEKQCSKAPTSHSLLIKSRNLVFHAKVQVKQVPPAALNIQYDSQTRPWPVLHLFIFFDVSKRSGVFDILQLLKSPCQNGIICIKPSYTWIKPCSTTMFMFKTS